MKISVIELLLYCITVCVITKKTEKQPLSKAVILNASNAFLVL